MLRQVLFILVFISSLTAWGQAGNDGGPHEFNIFMGNVLPNGIDGADEIFPLSGLRYSIAMSEEAVGFYEFGGVFGNGEGVSWQGVFASLRMDVPVETLVGFAYLGLDFTNYEGNGTEEQQRGGGHVGGGLMTLIGGNASVRFDMKLNTKPGTSLYFSLGLSFELGGGDANQ